MRPQERLLRKDEQYMAEKQPGYVYILTNPSFREDWIKIGKTTNMEERLRTLYNTSLPLPFEVFATLKTSKYNEAEKLVHHYIERFTNLRIRNNREFFNVKPEEALDIFKDVALVIDDAVIEEVHKREIMGFGEIHDSFETCKTPTRKESCIWLVPCNQKFFDIEGCLKRYGDEIYWTQHKNFQKGDTGYLYSASPDSAIRYSFEILAHDLPFSPVMEREKEFNANPSDFEMMKKHNRFALLHITGRTNKSRLGLASLMDRGLKKAPQGPMILSKKEFDELRKFIEENF